ncbi:MAG: hypothetical protein ACKOCK_10200, partial [Chloroflexota bacterium]
MDQELLRRVTRRGLTKMTGAFAGASALTKFEQVELALAKDRGRKAPVNASANNHRKRKKQYKMLVFGKASGPIYKELKKSYRMIKYTGKQDPGKYQGVLSDH